MKKLLISSWTFLLIALVFFFMHYPGGAMILILGTLLLFIHSIIYTIRNWKGNLSWSFFYLTFSTWTIYISFRLLYWPCGPHFFGFSLLFLIACFINIIWLRTYLKTRQDFKFPHFILVVYIVLSITISFVHSDEIYYFLNIEAIEDSGSKYNFDDCIVWDKYSWFLYNAGKYEKAVSANIKAQKAAKTLNQKSMLNTIVYHRTLIENKTWTNYSGALPGTRER